VFRGGGVNVSKVDLVIILFCILTLVLLTGLWAHLWVR